MLGQSQVKWGQILKLLAKIQKDIYLVCFFHSKLNGALFIPARGPEPRKFIKMVSNDVAKIRIISAFLTDSFENCMLASK